MSIEQTQAGRLAVGTARWSRRAIITLVFRIGIIGLALFLLGGSALPAQMVRTRTMAMAVSGWGFNLVEWEVTALAAKGRALIEQPGAGLDAEQGVALVREYMARAARVGELERQLVAGAAGEAPFELEAVQQELAELRAEQYATRPTVEQVIAGQVTRVLREAGFGVGPVLFPPVQFAFTDPPMKLVVSPRDRIEMVFSRMVNGGMPLQVVEQAEAKVEALPNASAYITEIGGLGAYPTMVVDQASLPWVLSTVAHEWVHNYLFFFPLGWSYFRSHDLTTLNETVAEIVGNEIGLEALRRYYPDLYAEALAAEAAQGETLPDDPGPGEVFDFATEMRKTRLEVDQLLAAGKVAEAEAYMAARRHEFIEAGYPLRVLNQAYFAFHGSYGTSAASTSPIGPKLEYLRSLMLDVETFLTTVRWFTSTEDLDRAIAERTLEIPPPPDTSPP
jgi:hypothetical protein